MDQELIMDLYKILNVLEMYKIFSIILYIVYTILNVLEMCKLHVNLKVKIDIKSFLSLLIYYPLLLSLLLSIKKHPVLKVCPKVNF